MITEEFRESSEEVDGIVVFDDMLEYNKTQINPIFIESGIKI